VENSNLLTKAINDNLTPLPIQNTKISISSSSNSTINEI